VLGQLQALLLHGFLPVADVAGIVLWSLQPLASSLASCRVVSICHSLLSIDAALTAAIAFRASD
jgi:hypothetical protein